MKKRLLTVAIAASVAVPVLQPTLVYAQGLVLEEIIVTSQRRAEDLQSVPVSVTAFSPELLDQLGVTDPRAMADFVPNVSIGDGTGRANVGAQFSIRGVNEGRISPVLDPAVGVYIDDVYYGRPQTNFLRLLDVERVEVLRGPQGTLFGKNSTGGAIRYVTKKADVNDGVNGYLKLGLGEYDRSNISGAVNVPLSDTVAARFAVAHMEQDGYVQRLTDGVGLGSDDTDFLSAAIRFQPNDQLTVDINVNHTTSESNGGATKLIDYFGFNGGMPDVTAPLFTGGISDLAAFNLLFPVGEPEHYAAEIPTSLYQTAGTGPIGSTDSESTGAALDINYDISSELSIRSITGYRTVDNRENRESNDSFLAESFFDGITDTGVDFWSQEVQLNGVSSGGDVNWVAGVYYSQEEPYSNEITDVDYRTPFFGTLQRLGNSFQETTSMGVFAQADWMILEDVTLTLGARWSEDDKKFRTYNTGVFDTVQDQRLFEIHAIDPLGPDVSGPGGNYVDIRPGPATLYLNGNGAVYGGCTVAAKCFLDPVTSGVVANLAAAQVSGGDTFTSVTPRVALEWQARDGVMLYAASSKGFKSGGTNDSVADINTPFDEETLWSYEIGTRFQSEDGRLRANLTAFTMDYDDKQLTVTTSDECENRCTTNVGNARIQGIEFEAIALLADSLRLNVGVGTLDAEWTDIKNLTAGVEEDSSFSRAPDLSFTFGLLHTLNLSSGASINSSINYAYKDDQESSGQDSTTLTIPDYGIANLRIAYTPAGGAWTASLYCNNCADEEYITGGAAWGGGTANTPFNFKENNHPAYVDVNPLLRDLNPASNAPPGITLVNIGPPRSIGLDFNYNF
jgi:iron complex outermembrane recepter protein